jgi:hypothetical protein
MLPSYFGITDAEFTEGLTEAQNKQFKPHPNLHYFVVAGGGHVLWFNPTLTSDGVVEESFITNMVTNAAKWTSVRSNETGCQPCLRRCRI